MSVAEVAARPSKMVVLWVESFRGERVPQGRDTELDLIGLLEPGVDLDRPTAGLAKHHAAPAPLRGWVPVELTVAAPRHACNCHSVDQHRNTRRGFLLVRHLPSTRQHSRHWSAARAGVEQAQKGVGIKRPLATDRSWPES